MMIYSGYIFRIIQYIHVTLNALLLPFGVYYTHFFGLILGAPVLTKKKGVFFLLLIVIAVYALYFFYGFISVKTFLIRDYFVNTVVFFASILYSVYIYYCIRYKNIYIHGLMMGVLNLSFLVAIVFFVIRLVGYDFDVWNEREIYGSEIIRLKLFFYEPSIYALAMSPFVIYGVSNALTDSDFLGSIKLFIITCLPIFLSMSAGVIGAILLSVLVSNINFLFKKNIKFKYLWFIVMMFCAIYFIPDGLMDRYFGLLSGNDSSGMIRTYYSIQSSLKMIGDYDILFGAGPGQIKYVINYYNSIYPAFKEADFLPNSIASTIASIGVLGILIKYAIIVFLCAHLKVYDNMYTKMLFYFLLIYQFTGGYANNIQEYAVYGYMYGFAGYMKDNTVR